MRKKYSQKRSSLEQAGLCDVKAMALLRENLGLLEPHNLDVVAFLPVIHELT